MDTVDLIIKNATCVYPEKTVKQDVAIHKGMIVDTGPNLNLSAKESLDAQGLHLLPGVIDSQVHFREPGLTHKEDLATGSLAAAAGGVTTFLEMPNTAPPTTTREALQEKINLAKGRSYADFGFFIGATEDNVEELVLAQPLEGVAGIKIFLGSSTGSLLLNDERVLFEIFSQTQTTISIHSENEELLTQRMAIRDQATSAHAHPEWRNVDTALSSTQAIVALARKAKRKIHILHVSTADEMEFLAQNKDICTVEVTPQHLTLIAPECYDRLGTYAQMNPPIRDRRHWEGLWKGVQQGIVDVIGSDHAPHTRDEKDRGYPHSPSGMPGVQTMLGLILHHVEQKRLSLNDGVRLIAETPAKLFQLNHKGRIEPGKEADLNLVDFQQRTTIRHGDMRSKTGWTPFDGVDYQGKLVATYLRGRPILEGPNGRPIQRAPF